MTAEEIEQLVAVVCEHYALKGSLLAQIEFVSATVEQARAHKDRVIAAGKPDEMEAAGQQFQLLSAFVEKLPQQLEEIERRIAEGRAAITAALQTLAAAPTSGG